MEKQLASRKWMSALNAYFFEKSRFQPLGLIRIVLPILCAYQVFRDYEWMQGLTFINPALDKLHEPSMLIKLLGLPFPLAPEYAQPFAVLYYVVAGCAALGLGTRPALFIFGLATIYLVDIDVSRGFFNHEASLISQVLLVLSVAPGSTSFSVDRLLGTLSKQPSGPQKPLWRVLAGPPVPAWGYKLILILLACTYFTAGVSKVRYGGMEWLDGQTLTHYLDGSANPYTPGNKPMYIGPPDVPQQEKWKDGFGIYTYSYGNRQGSPFWQKVGHFITATPLYIQVFAIAATLFELCAFALLLSGWPRVLYLLGAILMHKSIGFLMNLPFIDYQALCFLLIDWRWVVAQVPAGVKTLVKRQAKRVVPGFRAVPEGATSVAQ